jgi:ribonuclease III
MEDKELQFIQDQIGYNFKNPDLLQQAFVRRSYSKENGGEDNEVLEFIGDKALDVVIVKILIDTFGYYASQCEDFDSKNDFNEFCCEYSEGKLTELKSKLVNKKMLASRINWLRLADYLIMGKGDLKNKVDESESVKEDLFEAIIGAVTLDSGWDLKKIESTVEYMLEPESCLSVNTDMNYVAIIQEWSLKKYGELPQIHSDISSRLEEGLLPNKANELRSKPERDPNVNSIRSQEYFKSEMTFKGIKIKFIGYGKSKSEARKDVCKLAYKHLVENNLLFSIQDEIENPNVEDSINQLEILARRGYFSIPIYEFVQQYNENGNPVWKCDCYIDEYDSYFSSISSTKKDAKKKAAFEMLKFVWCQ